MRQLAHVEQSAVLRLLDAARQHLGIEIELFNVMLYRVLEIELYRKIDIEL